MDGQWWTARSPDEPDRARVGRTLLFEMLARIAGLRQKLLSAVAAEVWVEVHRALYSLVDLVWQVHLEMEAWAEELARRRAEVAWHDLAWTVFTGGESAMLALVQGGRFRSGEWVLGIDVIGSLSRRRMLVHVRRVGDEKPVAEWWFDDAGRRVEEEPERATQAEGG